RSHLRPIERHFVQELQAGDVRPALAGTGLLLGREMEQKLPDLALAHILGRPAVVGYEVPRAVHVPCLRPRGVSPKLQVLDHLVTQLSHDWSPSWPAGHCRNAQDHQSGSDKRVRGCARDFMTSPW